MLTMFTSGLDYRPAFFWGTLLPPNAVYVRVLVAAQSPDQAERVMLERCAPRYIETLREADPRDLPAAAVLHHVNRGPAPGPGAYLLVRTDEDVMGVPYARPRIAVYGLTVTGPIAIGRIRIVGMGRPTDPEPVAHVVDDDGQNDAVAMPDDREGPIPADDPVSTAVEYPAGRLGAKVREMEGSLPRGISRVRDQLDELLGDLVLSQRTADPRQACQRGASRLAELARKLDDLRADAHLIEVTLHAGN